MSNKINDWVVELGFDTSKVDKGLRDLDRKFKKINLNVGVGMKGGTGYGTGAPNASKVGNGYGGRFASNLTALTYEQRDRQMRNIYGAISSANSGIDSLSGNNSERAIELTKRLHQEKQKLIAAQKRLKTVNYSNTASFVQLKHSIAASANNIKDMNRDLQRFNSESAITKESAMGLMRQFRGVGLAIGAVLAALGPLFTIKDAAIEMDSLRSSMLAASGSSEQAGKDFEWARYQALRLGRDLQTSIAGYQQIGTAARAAGFSVDQAREIFVGAAEASTAFGLSSSDTAGVMRAFTQIMSKGNVQAEEIRGQLGDRLPGAFVIAAKAMGMTTDELNKQLKAGRVNSKEFMLNFVPALKAYANESGAVEKGMNSLRAAQNRMKTGFTDMTLALLDSGLKDFMIDTYDIIGNILQSLAPVGVGLINIFRPAMSVISMMSLILKESLLTTVALIDGLAEYMGFDKTGMDESLNNFGALGDIFQGRNEEFRMQLAKPGVGPIDALMNMREAEAQAEAALQQSVQVNINATGFGADEVAEKVVDEMQAAMSASLQID